METIPNKDNLNKNIKSMPLSGEDINSKESIKLILSNRPLIFTLPTSFDNNLLLSLTNMNYSTKNYKNFILGIRNDFKALDVSFKNILNAIGSDLSVQNLDDFIEAQLNGSNPSNSPFSKKDELEILDLIF